MKKKLDLTKGVFLPTVLPLPFTLLPYVYPLINRLFHPEDGIKDTNKSVIDIIKKGKKHGVNEMTINVKQDVGLSIKDIGDLKIDFVVGNRSDMDIKVKYK